MTFETSTFNNPPVLRRPDGEAFRRVRDAMKDRRAMRPPAEIERRRRKDAEDRAGTPKLQAIDADRRARGEIERLKAMLRDPGREPDRGD